LFLRLIPAIAAAAAISCFSPPLADAANGAVLFAAGGCANCHTDSKTKGPLLGGGAAIKTPFGTFYPPNISSHPEFGIGKWSDAEFVLAMRRGIAPGGVHLYPAFPYVSYTNLTDEDLLAIRHHILSLPPVAAKSRTHDLGFPFNIRFGMVLWNWLFLDEGPMRPDPAQSAEWNRGRYLADGLAHCGECHTPRNLLGGLRRSRWMAGNAKGEGPEGEAVPNISSHLADGIGKWSVADIAESLASGTLPDGDSFGSLMVDVVENGTAKLSDADRRAIAVYIKSLAPMPGRGPR
jgi:mono/diheme cytochrome c family protein